MNKRSFEELKKQIDQFKKDRNWDNLDPADLAKSIVIEAAELMEIYQWDNTFAKWNKKAPKKDVGEIRDEAADILIYLIQFSKDTGFDLLDAAFNKLKKNQKKYPLNKTGKIDHSEYIKLKKKARQIRS